MQSIYFLILKTLKLREDNYLESNKSLCTLTLCIKQFI
uniref:Uncharacterized protein n=1 Tax=Anguilla anguilla TaxID=7936 RepID=A0A0E9WLB1_ANGAN